MGNGLLPFRQGLERLVVDSAERPFLCDGNPLAASVFIVGFNPATRLNSSFWNFWSDVSGMDREAFMFEYLKSRNPKGVRPRIEAIIGGLAKGKVLETNIHSVATPRADQLSAHDRRTVVFEFLFDCIRPSVVFAHSNKPTLFFENESGIFLTDMCPVKATWRGHEFTLVVRRGPLWRASYAEAASIGALLGSLN